MSRPKLKESEKKKNITLHINDNLLIKIDELLVKTSDKRSRLIERLLLKYIKEKNDNTTPN